MTYLTPTGVHRHSAPRLPKGNYRDTERLDTMTPFAYSWRVLYEAAKRERDRNRLPELIANARRRIQDRELDLVHIADDTREEEAELQAALRHLWALENETLDTRQYPE